jgi:LBP / BPI / CETP family, C-terminal domain
MQALTVAISSSGMRALAQYFAAGPMAKALAGGLVPPSTSVSVPDITYQPPGGPPPPTATEYENIVVSLSGGSLTNFAPAFQSLTQGANGQFTVVLAASNVTVNYSWNEQYDTWVGFANMGHTNNTWGYSMGVDSFPITVPLTLTQQPYGYTLTVGTVSATPTGLHPNIPGNSIVQQPGPCFTTTVDNTTVKALENIDFQKTIQNLLQNVVGTIPASGQLTPDIVFNFNQGDTPLTFSSNEGLTLGVTGNVTWEGNAYSAGTPPSLGIPSIPAANHVHFYASDYEFNELYWAFFKDGRLSTTITAGQLPDPGMLNTRYYQTGALAPLYKKYPNLQMTVGVTPQAAPTVAFQTVYQLSYGDNGVLTTQEAALPANIYQQLVTLQGSVFLTQAAYTDALQTALGPDNAAYISQIVQASAVAGPFTQVYQVTSAGLSSLQSQLPPGVYSDLSGAMTVGQAFVDKAWLLLVVENALGTLNLASQYAPAIEAAFTVAGQYSQVYWVTEGTNGALATLVDQVPADVYNDLTGLADIVYLDQTSFLADLQNAIGSAAGQYAAQIQRAALVNGAIATHDVQAVFNVIKEGTTIPAFTVHFQETDFQQNFHLANAGYNQTVQFDFQLIDGETSATLVSSNIPGITASTFPSIWNFALQPAYALEMQKMAHTGVPLPFMAGLKFLFNQATVAIMPGYADVLADIQYVGTAEFSDALARDPNTVDLSSLIGQFPGVTERPLAPQPARMGAAGGRSGLHRTKRAATHTQLVRRETARSDRSVRPGTLEASLEENAAETFDFHFALGHLPGTGPFELHTGTERISLQPHTTETLTAYARRNAALGLLDEETRSTFTHYAEDVGLSPRTARILRVTYPSATAPIPELALLAVHVPLSARRAHRAQRLQRDAQGVPHNLAQLGVTRHLSYVLALAAADDADQLVTVTSSAAALVFMHPQLATTNRATAATIMDDHINSAGNLANIQRFQGQISRQGKNWQAAVPSADIHGNQLTWGPGFAKAGQPVYQNRLSDATIAGVAGAMQLPLTTSQQDPLLQNASWSVNQGTSAVYHVAPDAAQMLRAGRARSKAALAAANGGYAFTINNLTPGPGLSIDDSSLTFTPDSKTPGAGTLTINVTNNFLRSLYAYAQFLDNDGHVIQVPVDPPADGGQADDGPPQLADYLPIDVVTPVNVILGIPMPTEPTVLSFDWAPGAASARLVHGGLGTSRWDNDIVWPGAILTGCFNYAIPALFLIAGAELDSNAWFKALEEDKPTVAKLLTLGLGIFGAETSASIGFPDVSAIMFAMYDAMAGFLVHEGLEKLQEYILEKLGEAAFEDAIPTVDIIFQIANRAVDLAEMAETTIEVLTSPAVYEVDIVRTLNVQTTVSPDPTHGTSSNPAVWPQVATTWEAIVQYRGGTSHVQTGGMLGLNTPSQPITATFNALPAGGSLQVKFNVYAATGFLCGQYTSAWLSAGLTGNQETLTVAGSIQENVVPLTSATVYQYKQKLVYDEAASAHSWQPSQFTLDPSQAGSLDNRQISSAISAAFGHNGCALDTGATVNVINPGSAWTITDGNVVYRIAIQQEMAGHQMITVLMVSTGNIPLQVVTDLSADDTGHNLARLVNITMNDKAYTLGYCWRASDQNIPETGGAFPISTQIHAFQNINALANPQASLKFSPSGFVNQPAIVYDEFGPAPLFSVPSTFSAGLDKGGTVPSDLAALFAAFSYPLPGNAVVAVMTAGAAWTIGLPGAASAYSLARVTDVIEIHPYPTEEVSQRNYYVQPTSDSPSAYQYQLRQITLDNTTPFDMKQTQSWGVFTLPFNDDFVVHPQGYVIAISYTLSRMMILKLPDAPSPDDQVVSAVITSGPAGNDARQGLMNGPVALSVTADGRILVLEQGTSTVPGRIQSFDVNGNPVPSFDGRTITTVPASYTADLDAGLVSASLRQAFASAGSPLSGVWLVQDGTTLYQLADEGGTIVVTSGGADLSLNWTIRSGTSSYELNLDGPAISVAQDGKTLFTIPASLARNLNTGITAGDVAAAFSQNKITLTAPVSITGDRLTLDPSVVTDLVQGTVPASLTPSLTARGLSLSANATVSASVVVTVREPGSLWTLQDLRASSSYKITRQQAGGVLDIIDFVPTAPLYDPRGLEVTYLSMSTELKGYIYVLSYVGAGRSVTDYRLDIYQPNGPWLARTAGVNAAKVVVDMWRNLYTLNYESFQGPGGRTEPSVSTWMPST